MPLRYLAQTHRTHEEPVADATAFVTQEDTIEVVDHAASLHFKGYDEQPPLPRALVAIELHAKAVVAGDQDFVLAVDVTLAPALGLHGERVAARECLDDLGPTAHEEVTGDVGADERRGLVEVVQLEAVMVIFGSAPGSSQGMTKGLPCRRISRSCAPSVCSPHGDCKPWRRSDSWA